MDIREVHFWTVKHCTVILEIKKKQKQKQKTKKQKNTDFFQNTCFKESKILTVEKNLRVTKNFSKILCLPVIAWSKTHLSKHGCISNIDIGEIFFFCSCYFWWLVSRFFSSRVTNLQCNLVCEGTLQLQKHIETFKEILAKLFLEQVLIGDFNIYGKLYNHSLIYMLPSTPKENFL